MAQTKYLHIILGKGTLFRYIQRPDEHFSTIALHVHSGLKMNALIQLTLEVNPVTNGPSQRMDRFPAIMNSVEGKNTREE